MKSFFVILSALVLFSCSEEKKQIVINTSSPVPNMLLPDILEVDYTVMLDTTQSDSWQTTFKSVDFLKTFRNKVHKGEIPVYSPFYDDTNQARITIPYLEIDLGKYTDNNDFKWGNYFTFDLGFTEQWHFDTTSMQFIKSTKWWYPYFFSTSDSSYHHIFKVLSGDAEEILAENLIHEINFTKKEFNFRYFDYNRFYEWLVDAALRGKIKVFPPDNFNQQLNSETIKERLGEQFVKVAKHNINDSIHYEDVLQKYDISELKGIIFIEAWFFNSKNGCISKSVSGFAPVRYYEDESGNILKSIPFVFFTGEKKTNIL